MAVHSPSYSGALELETSLDNTTKLSQNKTPFHEATASINGGSLELSTTLIFSHQCYSKTSLYQKGYIYLLRTQVVSC